MKPYTYLLINFFTIVVCFVFSFHRKIQFNRHFPAFIKSSVLVAIPFIAWDVWFTKQGVWWFNNDYTTGLALLGMPIEEWLFFICIPYACVFTYFCLVKFYDLKWHPKNEAAFSIVFSVLLFALAALYFDRIYTLVTFASTAVLCLYLKFVAKVDWFGESATVYGILLFPFFIVNGILTGTGIDDAVVRYNPDDFMGFRIMTIPVEDAVYGFELFLLNLLLFKLFQRKHTDAELM